MFCNGCTRKVIFVAEQATPDGNGASISTREESITKKKLLEVVSDWWDGFGTHLDDFDTLHIKFVPDKNKKEK